MTALGFWRYAREFTDGAKVLYTQDTSAIFVPAYYLVAHGSELAFKAFLRAKGHSIEHLKKLGHDLHRLVKAAEKEGLSDVAPSTKEFRAAIDLINPYYREKELEYIKTGAKSYPEITYLIDGNETLLKNIKPLCISNTLENKSGYV